MSQNLQELCALLVDDFYGELSSRVWTALARTGRTASRALPLLSQLSAVQVKYGLVVLIQQHLVHHYSPDDEETTYYDINWPEAYNLVRSAKIIELAESRCGRGAGEIVQNLIQLGHARVDDLLDNYGRDFAKHNGPNAQDGRPNGEGLPNGIGKELGHSKTHDPFNSLDDVRKTLQGLLQAGFISQVHAVHFRPAADIHAEAERRVLRERFSTDGPKGSKAQAEFRLEVRKRKKKWREEGDEPAEQQPKPNGVKRQQQGEQPARKKQRVNGYRTSHDVMEAAADGSDVALNEDTVIRLNYDRYNVALRNQQLVGFAAAHLGASTAKVYSRLLECMEERIPRCFDELVLFDDRLEERDACPTVTTLQVSKCIDPNVDLGFGDNDGDVGGGEEDPDGSNVRTMNGFSHKLKDERRDSGFSTPQTPLTPASKEQLSAVERHIKLLAEDPRRFVTWAGSRGRGEWRVDFRSLVTQLMQREIESIITSRFGPLASRIIRVLHAKGKLDEKQLSTLGLLKQKDIRCTLTAMQEVGLVDIQEVPKDNSRQPAKTIYLWFYDQSRCRALILDDTYKAMARLLQRARVEKEKIRSVIDKAERTDVVGREDQFLNREERNALARWRDTEEKLLRQLNRQDELVALLRDFLGPPPEK